DESLKKTKILRFNLSNNTGLPKSTTRSIILNNKIYFITIKGLYSFNSSKNKFLPANFFGEEFTGGNRGIHTATMIKDSTYLLFAADVELGFLKFISGKAIWDPTIFKGLELKQINAIYVDPQGRSWFGGSEKKVIRYDPALAERSNTTYKTLLRKVIIGRDSIYFNGSFYTCKLYGQDCRKKKQTNEHLFNHVYATEQTQEFHTSIPYDLNSITFEIAAPFYKKSEKIRYKYWLRGFEYSWSPFIYESKISYPRLPEGEYTFYAKAINIYDEEGQATTFKFIIQPPWYRTTFAYVSYFFLFTMVLYTSIQISIARLKAAKKRLERMVKDRTLEIVEKNIMLEKQKEEIEYEKDKSENLLLNILPRVTAEELKLKGRATPHYYDNVTVLFTDFKGFTMVAEKMHPDDLIAELDICFNNFDKIIEEHHIEKIKTMGDAYMCAGGIPKKNITNPMDVVLAGLKIQKFMEEFKNERLKKNKPFWEIRIGIHSGPIVAGVVGSKKFAYDIWGDTVNTASRMESSGEPGRVNISGATYELVEEYFNCSYRGKVKAKNKGEIDMHFVDSIKPEFSLDENHYLPNKSFVSKLHTMSIESIGRAQSLDEMDFNFLEVQRYVKKRFKKELPKDLYYHDLDHTMDVCSVVEVIAREEGVDDANIILLKTAALLHDIGFLEQYKDHEKKGVKITQKILPGFGYTTLQIATIGGMIMATKIPHLPKNHLEEIICDADLDYLGRDDFEEISLKLKTEFQEHGIVNSDLDWEQLQLSFFKKHRYFTKYSIQNRNPSKLSAQKQIEQRMTALQPSS
ncbi:MAG: HD domain-containing protein, partial [Bacteroidia bacterium]|nr:HD domain-containing protein [Bacteroidia bacterium]